MRPITLLASGLILVAAGLIAAAALPSSTGFGTLTTAQPTTATIALGDLTPVTPAPPTAAPPASASSTTAATPAWPVPTRAAVLPRPATRSAHLDSLSGPDAPAAPTHLALPSIAVDAPITPVGVIPETREMEIPENVRTVGWYRHGAAPGDAQGTAVLVAHVDDRRQGRGAFFDLRELREGDRAVVDLADGDPITYEVSARRQLPKSELPSSIFERTGPHRLVLLTCGGAFDADRRTYEDNIIIVAEAIDP